MTNRTITISGQPYDPQIHVDGSDISSGAREALIALGWTPPGARPTGIGGSLSFSDATPIMTCQCGVRCFGDSINDALKAWSGHVTTAHRDDWAE